MEEQTHRHSSSSSSPPSDHDVFLSFSGRDTTNTFTGHLYSGLGQAGIATFMANEKLKIGGEIGPALKKAIAGSRISIPIFSINYASSKWCLNELVQIMESRQAKGQKVLPIFYHVNPRDVRNQIGCFGEKFDELGKRYDDKRTVERWKKALKEAGELKGWDLEDVDNRNESMLIKKVCRHVQSEIPSNVPKKHFGIDSFVTRLIDLLNVQMNDVRFVGIWGMRGIGKSTVAMALFQQIAEKFEGSILLEDVGAASKQPKGLVRLQTELLCVVLRQEIQLISFVDGGKCYIRKCLHAKKVLIILDNVDKLEQLEALAGEPDWFGPGSRIIITTRDKHVLTSHNVPEIYEVKELYFYPSLQLFRKHAFGNDQPPDNLMKLAMDLVLSAGGLPFALKAFGYSLSSERSPERWKTTRDKLRKIPHSDVQAMLKLSYDELQYPENEIFLDISCFFNGIDKDYVTAIEEGCGFFGEIGVETLIKKSFVKIDYNNKLRIHDQLRDMGRYIVHQESPDEPGKRSRLWSQEEIMNVLNEREGTRCVKGIILKFEGEETALEDNYFHNKDFNHFYVEDFEAMSKLRLLQIDNVHLVGDFKKFPKQLRWLSWKGCPLESIPTDFGLEKVVVLDLSKSRIRQVWNDLDQNKHFRELKFLILSKCRDLVKTPDFSRFPNLERLNLEGCIKLEELTSSICKLKSLKNLILSGCSNLNKVPELYGSLNILEVIELKDCELLGRLPDSIGDMINLTTLSLDGTSIAELPDSVGLLENIEVLTARHCKKLVKLPDSMRKMKRLMRFEIDETGIDKLPEDFGMLSSLEVFRMPGCVKFRRFPENFGNLGRLRDLNIGGNSKLDMLPISFSHLCSLASLDASCCNLSEDGIPSDFGKLASLEKLYLSYNSFCSLPASISNLFRLECLALDNCRNLQSLPKLPSSLRILDVKNCVSLQRLPNLSNLKGIYQLNISNCKMLAKIQGIEEMKSLQELYTSGCSTALVNGLSRIFGQGVLQHLPVRLSFPNTFTLQKLKLSEAVIWDEKRCEIRLECEEIPSGAGNPEQHRKIIGLDLRFFFTNQEISDIYVQVNRNGEPVYSQQRVSDTRFFTPRSHRDQPCLCRSQDCFYRFVCELKEGDEISFTIETALETEVNKSGMHVVYGDTKQSTCCRRIGDFFACSYDDDDNDGGRASSRKRRKLQLLDHGDESFTSSSLKKGYDQPKKELFDLNLTWSMLDEEI